MPEKEPQMVQFGCKLDVNPEFWDAKAGKAIGRAKEIAEINASLENMKVSIRKLYNKQLEEYGYVLPEKIRNQVLGIEQGAKTLVQFMDLHN